MKHDIWQKIVAAAAAKGVEEQRLYDSPKLRSQFAAQVGQRGGRKSAAIRRRKSAETAAIPAADTPKQLTLNLF